MAMTSQTSKRRYWLAGNRDDGQDRFFREALDPAIWEAGDADCWDACWYTGMPAPEVFEQLTPHKWINHIPGNNAMTVKSRLAGILRDTHAQMVAEEGPDGEGARRMAFFPDTYPMPHAYHDLQAAAHAEPGTRWILKPKNSARGQDISLVRDVAAVPSGNKWMVQRYLHDPHTMHGHKYVLRLYVLITSVEPLRVYLYHEGFAKLASEPYDLNTPENIFSHLTNPDINATNTGAPAPVVFVPLEDYRAWLRDEGIDDDALMARVRDLVRLTVISAREPMRHRLSDIGADTSGCYELLGLDCLVDSTLEPWILECNLSPSLDICAAPKDGGDKEYVIKRQLVHDMVDMLGFNRPRPDHPQSDPATRIVAEAEEELAHSGGWERICPAEDGTDHLSYFPLPRLADVVLADAVAGRPVPRPTTCVHRSTEIVGDDGLAVYAEENATLYRLNPTAAWIWLKATGGEDPDSIGEELAALRGSQSAEDLWISRDQTWSQLADWAAQRLLRKAGVSEDNREPAPGRLAVPSRDDSRRDDGFGEPDSWAFTVGVGDRRIGISPGSAAVQARLHPLLKSIEAASGAGDTDNTVDATVTVRESRGGYAMTLSGRPIASDLLLAGVAPVLRDTLLGLAVDNESVGVLEGTVLSIRSATGDEPFGIFIASSDSETWEGNAVEMAGELEASLSCGLLIGAGSPASALPVSLPARVPENVFEQLVETGVPAVQHPAAGMTQMFQRKRYGRLVPPTAGPNDHPLDIGAVVIPQRQHPEGDTASVQSLSMDDAVAALLTGYRGPRGSRPTTEQIDALVAWMERRALWSVPAGDRKAAARALSRELRRETTARPVPAS